MYVDLVDFLVDTDSHCRHLQATEEPRLATNVQRLGEYERILNDFEVRALRHLLAIDEHHQRPGWPLRKEDAATSGSVFSHLGIVSRFPRRGSK
jgi:hypothetical protein